METNQRDEFSLIIRGLAETFGRQLSDSGLLVYWLGLQDLAWDDFKSSLAVVLRSKFMPTVAEFREAAGVDSSDTLAIKAWESVSEAASNIGSYHNVSFEDGAINATVRSLGGWVQLLGRTGEDFDKWARKEFIETYKHLVYSVSGDSEQCRPLSGIHGIGDHVCHVGAQYRIAESVRRLPEQQQLEDVQERHPGTGEAQRVGELLRVREMPSNDEP